MTVLTSERLVSDELLSDEVPSVRVATRAKPICDEDATLRFDKPVSEAEDKTAVPSVMELDVSRAKTLRRDNDVNEPDASDDEPSVTVAASTLAALDTKPPATMEPVVLSEPSRRDAVPSVSVRLETKRAEVRVPYTRAAVPSVKLRPRTAPPLDTLPPIVMAPDDESEPRFRKAVPSVSVELLTNKRDESEARAIIAVPSVIVVAETRTEFESTPPSSDAVPSLTVAASTEAALDRAPACTVPVVENEPLRRDATPSVKVAAETRTPPFKLPEETVSVPSVSVPIVNVVIPETCPPVIDTTEFVKVEAVIVPEAVTAAAVMVPTVENEPDCSTAVPSEIVDEVRRIKPDKVLAASVA